MEDTLGAEPQAAPKAVVWSRHSSGHRSRMLCELPETDERDLSLCCNANGSTLGCRRTAGTGTSLPLTGALFWLRANMPLRSFFGEGDAGGQALRPFKGLPLKALPCKRLPLSAGALILEDLPNRAVGSSTKPASFLLPPDWLLTLAAASWAECIAGKAADFVGRGLGLDCQG